MKTSSTDPLLTALAQLGAHRLKAKRGLITLSTRETEYILAESGIGLSLQQDDDKNDPLWHGAGALSKQCGLGMQLCRQFCADENLSHLVFNDLRTIPEFQKQMIVTCTTGPQIKFLTCVPLRSPLYKMVIGTYIVVDDEPRNGLSDEEIEFMIDMGVTVMDHLEAQRNNRKSYRSERMVKAIGLFIEGKSTLREWWLQGGHKAQQTIVRKRTKYGGANLEGQADLEFGIQDPAEQISGGAMEMMSDRGERPALSRSPSSSTLSHIDHRGDGRPKMPSRESMFTSSDGTSTTPSAMSSVFTSAPRAESITTADTAEDRSPEHVRHTSVAFDMPPEGVNPDVSKELQEALLTKDLRAVFARASNLIREAGGVDGSIFYDASVGSFGAASEKDIMGQKAPGNFHIDEAMTTSDDDVARKSEDTDTSTNGQTNGTGHQENCCSILGFSTRKRSTLKGHSPPPEHHTFPDKVLRTLLKRYPHGKVFNFDEDGSFSSSDTDNAYLGEEGDGPKRLAKAERNHQRRKVSREVEAAALLKALPGARSIFWFPLWDPSRERWYAGSLMWTNSATRTLCPIEDLTYLAAFGNSIMAEVARLSALVITQMKTDFISSISHELRSPLHGVLASVEFLQETDLNDIQADMVSNIQSSGRVLLDTINHVLDFSKVNRKVKTTQGKVSRTRKGQKPRLSFHDHENLDNTAEPHADICVLSEEVVESVWAGRNLSKVAYDTPNGGRKSNRQSMAVGEPAVTVVMDVKWEPNWTYEVDAGAWRRILLNLFGNSMKYTKAGYIKVSLTMEETATIRGKKTRSALVLKVKDSGKGISKEFLKHHLYKPFTQEDSLAVGAGLGLSIVRHIIQDLGGEIDFASEQGVGTEATVKIPLQQSPPISNEVSDLLAEVKASTKGKKFSLEGFDMYPELSETPTGILSADFEGAMFLKSSVHNMLNSWFGMVPVGISGEASSADVIVIMESGLPSLVEKLQNCAAKGGPSVAIVLCSTYPATSASTSFGSLRTLHHAFTHPITPPTNGLDATKLQNITNLSTDSTHKKTQPDISAATPTEEPSVPLTRMTTIDTSIVPSEGMRVLLVEDNEINMKLLVAYMRKLKLSHTTAINGLEALNAYKEAKGGFDVIFMDISMPIMDGIESTRHIRRFERETSINPCALIALTGAANPNTRLEAFSSGIDLFLTKPVPMKSLKIMLDGLKTQGREGLSNGKHG
ncbi:hypothetical protein EJ08DRAFT_588418 [Tothia fuscella]|uniref:Histidine kinase n=1 Tax=Tothia fuscella TaxID=1048955 RepID=A0A9P4NRN0_9PEZI|nr:hypothetical protein EJ08DRAFT_588418 [Tothia fuscella]